MKTAVLVALLALTAGAAALKCYTCSSVKGEIAGVKLDTPTDSPSCDDFDPSSPDKKFEKDCPAPSSALQGALQNVCIRYVDSGDSKAQLRGCSVGDASVGCVGGLCFCGRDLCNGSGPRGEPSAALLLLLLLAAVAAILGAC